MQDLFYSTIYHCTELKLIRNIWQYFSSKFAIRIPSVLSFCHVCLLYHRYFTNFFFFFFCCIKPKTYLNHWNSETNSHVWSRLFSICSLSYISKAETEDTASDRQLFFSPQIKKQPALPGQKEKFLQFRETEN